MTILGVSTRIVECLRIAQMIERHGELFLRRVFTEDEIAFCSARTQATQVYASYWAGKEAVINALGGWRDGMRWVDIELRQDGMEVRVALAGAARELCEQQPIGDIHAAISFCRTHATAYVIVTAAEIDRL